MRDLKATKSTVDQKQLKAENTSSCQSSSPSTAHHKGESNQPTKCTFPNKTNDKQNGPLTFPLAPVLFFICVQKRQRKTRFIVIPRIREETYV